MTKILIVDDFESSRNILERTLTNAGYAVLKSEDGTDALKSLDGQRVDLVITDLNMPNMDGLTLSRSIRELPHYKHTPIVLLTTSNSAEQHEKARASGITATMTKPYEVETLLRNIKKIVR